MKKISVLFLSFVLFSIGVLGCQQSEKEENKELTNEPAIIGEIVTIEDGRFLVESTTEKLPDGKPDAIWFSTDEMDSLKVGQIVSVWASAIDQSYPGQARADRIEIKE